MSRLSFLLVIILAAAGNASSQVAQWLIHPEHDKISVAEGENLIITQDDGMKTLWDFDGNKLSTISTNDVIHPFAEGAAVTTTIRGDIITGFYKTDGSFTPLNVPVAYSSTRFNDGYLLAKDGDYFCFINQDGKTTKTNLVTARPFCNGYASCSIYKNHEKQKDERLIMLLPNMVEWVFKYDDEVYKDNDIDFISSVNDENVGIVIMKEKVFYFNGRSRQLKPMYATRDGSPEKKDKQVKIEKGQWLTPVKKGLQITAADKKRQVIINMDELYRPTSIQYADNETFYYEKNEPEQRSFTSRLNPTQEKYNPQGKLGLYWGTETEVLPPQFDKVGTLIDDKAMVMLDGQWGLLRVHPNDKFEVILNKGNKIAFKHKTFEAPIRLCVPAVVPTNKTKLEILYDDIDADKTGCRIFPQTAKASQSYDGIAPGYIDYECELDFPPYLPDEIDDADDENNEINYIAQVTYDGLKSPRIHIKAYGWQYKYISPYITDGVIQNGNYSCTLRLDRNIVAGEAIYPVKVSLLADTLQYDLIKTSEDLYNITIYNIHEGNNVFEVIISEGDEQVPIDTNFEIQVPYSKPQRNTTTATAKQPVNLKANVARKKSSKPKKPKTPKKAEPEPEFRWH